MKNSLPGILVNFTIFYGYFHCWVNGWAELLYFGDRMFYSDWWASVNYSEYYRKWNMIVQDWIRTYLFDEIRHHLPNNIKNKMATVLIIILSAIIHDYLFCLTLNKFIPTFIFLYGIIGGMYLIIP
ncbi:hypothetical protein HZS_7887 [Henneguya salminicola]|nr:hypothetical protein HZS_7887 [Henneguya salminicola]